MENDSTITLSSHVGGGFRFEEGGVTQRANSTWFRGENCNFNPSKVNMNQPEAVQRYVLNGWMPPKPHVTPDTKIVAFGSCFAANITKWLSRRNFNVLTSKESENANAYIVRFGEGMVNTFVLRQQFEWALENKTIDAELWHGYDAQAYGYDEEVRLRTQAMFLEADVFVITLGLSEIWYDELTGGVFWRAVPQDKYDPSRHKFRVSSVEESRENIRAIYDLITRHRPDAKIIFTLSPIPLVATFRPNSCITSNSVSKAVLRAAVDEEIRAIADPDRVFYWPSYEIVMDVFGDRWIEDRRHVKPEILDFIMTLFEENWCQGSAPEVNSAEMWMRAKAATGDLPARLPRWIEIGRVNAIEKTLKNYQNAPARLALVKAALDAAGTRIGGDTGAKLKALAEG